MSPECRACGSTTSCGLIAPKRSVGPNSIGSLQRGVQALPQPNLSSFKRRMGNRTKEDRVALLAAEKSHKIQLTNHKTGWYALCRIWDDHPEHRRALRAMGYGGKIPFRPHDFTHRYFPVDNGSNGKCPVTSEDWQKVGIQEPHKICFL